MNDLRISIGCVLGPNVASDAALLIPSITTLGALAALLLGACHSASVAPSKAEPPVEPLEYPPGPWWEAPTELERTMLAGSVLLVSHREVNVGLGFGTKLPPPVIAPQRTKEDALRRGQQLAARLSAQPTLFAALARRESDDAVTASRGGSLGTFFAPNIPNEMLDAFGALKIGETSRVFETDRGYEIVRRLAVPESEQVSFSQILIKHDAASGWRRMVPPVPGRSRADALLLAKRVAALAQARPDDFDNLVELYSESDGGADRGVWSTFEDKSHEFPVFDAASHLAMGQVSDPIESIMGFHVLRRTQVEARPLLAASIVIISYVGVQADASEPLSGRSKPKAEAITRALISELSRAPELFARRRAEYCEFPVPECEREVVWKPGHGLPVIERVLPNLTIGQVAEEPVDSPVGYLVVRREDPEKLPPPDPIPATVRFDLPTVPEPPKQSRDDVATAELAPDYAAAAHVEEVSTIFQHLMTLLPLSDRVREDMMAALDEFTAHVQATSGSELGRDHKRLESNVKGILGADLYDDFVRYRNGYRRGVH